MKTLKVVIEVLGGVAYVAKCPEGVTVEIIDHDNESERVESFRKAGAI